MYTRKILILLFLLCGNNSDGFAPSCYYTVVRWIYFEKNSATLSTESQDAVALLIDEMKNKPLGQTVELDGYASADETETTTNVLSESRAFAIKILMMKRGIDGSRIICRGLGYSNPVEFHTTVSGYSLSRRVEYRFIKKGHSYTLPQ